MALNPVAAYNARPSPRGTPRAFRGGVAHRNVEVLIGRLVTNPAVRRRFADDAVAVLREFQEEGHELTAIEVDAVAATDPVAIRIFAEAIDGRIRRADTIPEPVARSSSVRGGNTSRAD